MTRKAKKCLDCKRAFRPREFQIAVFRDTSEAKNSCLHCFVTHKSFGRRQAEPLMLQLAEYVTEWLENADYLNRRFKP